MSTQEKHDLPAGPKTRVQVHGNDRRTKSNVPSEWVIVANGLTGIVSTNSPPDDQDKTLRTIWEPRDPFATFG